MYILTILWDGQTLKLQVRYGTKYKKMDQVKFVEDSL